jgi:hypothetical protein
MSGFSRAIARDSWIQRVLAMHTGRKLPKSGRHMYARGENGRSPRGRRKEEMRLDLVDRILAAAGIDTRPTLAA